MSEHLIKKDPTSFILLLKYFLKITQDLVTMQNLGIILNFCTLLFLKDFTFTI